MTTHVLSLDDTLALLEAEYRRAVVDALPPECTTTTEQLVEDIHPAVDGTRDSVATRLRHRDLPLLARHEVIEQDADCQCVRATPLIEELHTTLWHLRSEREQTTRRGIEQ